MFGNVNIFPSVINKTSTQKISKGTEDLYSSNQPNLTSLEPSTQH